MPDTEWKLLVTDPPPNREPVLLWRPGWIALVCGEAIERIESHAGIWWHPLPAPPVALCSGDSAAGRVL